MNKFKKQLYLLLVIILLISCNEEKEVLYQVGNKVFLTEIKIDSIVDIQNKKMKDKNIDMIFRKEVIDTLIDGNKITYKYNINGGSAKVIENANNYKQMIGKTLPEFSFKSLGGKLISSNDLKGKPIVINMWFTTCAPCIAEMPELNKIKARNKNSKTQFIAMTYESKEKVNDFLNTREFNFDHIVGVKEYCEKFTKQYPINIFVNKKGVIDHIEDGMPLIYDRVKKQITNKVNPLKFLKALKNINN